MDNLQMWSLLVGFASPLLISVVQQPGWSKKTRSAVTFAASILLGLGSSYFDGSLSNAGDTVGAVLLVLVTGQTTYQSLWKQIGLAPAIEAATSRTGSASVEETIVTEPTAVPDEPAKKDAGYGLVALLGAVLFLVGVVLTLIEAVQAEAVSVVGVVLLVVGLACMAADDKIGT